MPSYNERRRLEKNFVNGVEIRFVKEHIIFYGGVALLGVPGVEVVVLGVSALAPISGSIILGKILSSVIAAGIIYICTNFNYKGVAFYRHANIMPKLNVWGLAVTLRLTL